MITILHNKRRQISLVLLFAICFQFAQVPLTYALTSGPSQPEVQGFQPAGTSEMVDLFTGDFSYNIPLFELPGPNGGYPFNLAYQSGVNMDQEASWVGLGWSLNPGAINRQMRGLPDEFSGDSILTKTTVAPSVTVGMGAGVGAEFFGKSLGASVGFGVSMNSYKGLGYSIDASLGFSKAVGGGMTGNIGLNVSLDSKEGVGVSPSLGLGGKVGHIGLGIGYNSKTGLNSMTLSQSIGQAKAKDKQGVEHVGGSHISSSSTLSLSHPGYTPQITLPMKNISLSATLKLGSGWWGVFPSAYVRGFYNEQWLNDDNKVLKAHAFGYLNYQKSIGDGDLLDINREKEGMVSQESPNLAIPSLTYDVYSVTGQGIGAMYRPMRNDLGVVHDQEISSVSIDASGGVDVGPPFHVGGNLSVNHSKSTSGKWKDNNTFATTQTFQDKSTDNVYEPWYFKVHGESAAEDNDLYNKLGGDQAMRVQLSGDNANPGANPTLENNSLTKTAVVSSSVNRERKSRNQVIQTITNGQLMSGATTMISLFKVQYLNSDSIIQSYDRSSLPKHHIAGLTALTAEGLRYNYGIPAYNTYQEEVSFTSQKQSPNAQVNRVNLFVNDTTLAEPKHDYPGTDQFLRSTKMPPYAHSYLLTSIVGPDYVDVTDDGVTPDDLGYWVKFTYKKMNSSSNPYRWRDPFSQAHYQEGWKTDPRDDRGSFTYGEKELWYLAQAETRSHIAAFTMKQRQDGFGVEKELQDKNHQGNPVYYLQKIALFSRFAQNKYNIKVVQFDYDYSLCPGVFNNLSNGGKLTLKKVWFEYGSSHKGRLNPYNFTYHQNNPNYSLYAYDRWGTYKPYPDTDPLQNIDGPYSLQDPSQKQQIDANAAAWSLTEIQLPSGGKVIVNYETDDYGYVQQQPAAQMMELVDPYTNPINPLSSSYILKDSASNKVRFVLEQPIASSQNVNQRNEVLKYLDQQRKQLYFKIKVNLRSPGEGFYEYISGYADIDFTGSGKMGLEKNAAGDYMYGYFHVVGENGFHPFSARAWQHLRTDQPELANSDKKLSPASSNGERINQIKSLGSILTQVRQMFEGFNSFCKSRNWGREVLTSKSWMRLNSPDKIKYGGGLRVRQVTIKDQWTQNEEGIYGQVYEYTTQEGADTISSGVAAYEPLVGGDENSIHYAKKFTQSVPLRSDNNLYFEYPVNESYYPGPQVGYGKVTVTSLAAASLAGKELFNVTLSDGKTLFPQGGNVSYGTTGMTVHEFYTAKDFPVLTDETDKKNKPYKLNVIIPFLGTVTVSNLTASQGYSIITNDMHGKQKIVSNYRQDRTGKIESQPISWVRYNYRTDNTVSRLGNASTVSNVFKDNGDGTLSVPSAQEMKNQSGNFLLGQETEFFTDMRQFQDLTWGGGANANVDVIIIPLFFAPLTIPIPTAWPNVSKSTIQLRTAVTNKVIFKSGILESTEAFDEGSHVVTKNLKWDKQTGAPVLTQVTNDFDAPIYDFSIPAYTQYQGMGAAYRNAGLSFTLSSVSKSVSPNEYQFTSSVADGLLCPGDELLLYSNTKLVNPIAKAVYTGNENGPKIIFCSSTLSQPSYTALITRSGYRNQLSVMAGSIKALQDPSIPGTPVTYSKAVTVVDPNPK